MNILENPLGCVTIAQVHQIPKEEFMAEDGTPVKEPLGRYSIFHKLPEDEGANDNGSGKFKWVSDKLMRKLDEKIYRCLHPTSWADTYTRHIQDLQFLLFNTTRV